MTKKSINSHSSEFRPRVVYSRQYNIGFYGLERLHPFDSRKYGRAWKQLRRHFGSSLNNYHRKLKRPASREELLLVHTEEYLNSLRNARYVANALEVDAVRRLPSWAIDLHVLRPMRWATRGTMVAAEEAIAHGFSVNLGGGYHHAKPDRGEGFSIYADAAIAVASLRKQGLLSESALFLLIRMLIRAMACVIRLWMMIARSSSTFSIAVSIRFLMLMLENVWTARLASPVHVRIQITCVNSKPNCLAFWILSAIQRLESQFTMRARTLSRSDDS